MQSVILVRDNPRSLALRPAVIGVDTPSVLIFEQHAEDYYRPSYPRCTVKLARPHEFDLSKYIYLNSRPVFGCLGLIHISNDIFLAVVTDCQHIGRIRPGEEVYRIQSVSFYSLSSNVYDDLDLGYKNDAWDDEASEQNPQAVQHPCAQLQKLFASGSFYFSPDFDLTRTVQARTISPTLGVHSFDDHFLWNSFMIRELLNFRSNMSNADQAELDRGGFLVLAIQGYVGIEEPYVGSDRVELSVISKLSCKRAGTRFNTRGIDDNGHVANYVETETVLHTDQWTFAYTQVRGSVPVFWEQQGLQVMAHKIQISRGAEATQPAVERHFREQLLRYGEVHTVNLLAQKENNPELALSAAYVKAVQTLSDKRALVLPMTNFDYHAECKGGNYENVTILTRRMSNEFERFGYFLGDAEGDQNGILLKQQGVFRTNCVDCLDRTNMVQCEISRRVLYLHLTSNLGTNDSWRGGADEIFARHQNLWAENGDGLSRIYAGTGALKSSVTRTGKVTLASVLGDATKSVNRFYINNFQDKAKQEVIDLLLGKLVHQKGIVIHDPVNDSVNEALVTRTKEYSTTSKITVFAGTYNLNGKSSKGESLAPWLLNLSAGMAEPEIYAIGFQEIVELSPQQIMITDVEKRLAWEFEIEKTLNSRCSSGSRYVLLRSDQLVGAALIVYAKESVVAHVRNVECSIKKTGLRGMAGNKGAVAIRMDYCDTSMCFVAAHLAAGQLAWEDRNNDYHTISEGLFFARGRTIDSHDNVIWVSDLNYRIALSNEEVRAYVAEGNLAALLGADQLLNQMGARQVFVGYKEGDITFLPTYKYDNGTDVYDTSEKQRIPSWTDRILYRGSGLRQISYNRAELFTSDHRPVMALFEAQITQLDKEARDRIQKELYFEKSRDRGALMTGSTMTAIPKTITPSARRTVIPVASEPMVVEDVLIDFGVDEVPDVDLPPPSSDSYKWWEEEDREWFIDAIPPSLGTNNPFDQTSIPFGTTLSNVLIDPYGEILDQPSEADEAVAWIPIQPLNAKKKLPAPAPRPRSANSHTSDPPEPTNTKANVMTPIAATLSFDPPPNEQAAQEEEEKVDPFAFWNEKQGK